MYFVSNSPSLNLLFFTFCTRRTRRTICRLWTALTGLARRGRQDRSSLYTRPLMAKRRCLFLCFTFNLNCPLPASPFPKGYGLPPRDSGNCGGAHRQACKPKGPRAANGHRRRWRWAWGREICRDEVNYFCSFWHTFSHFVASHRTPLCSALLRRSCFRWRSLRARRGDGATYG